MSLQLLLSTVVDYPENERRLHHLRALYDEGYAQKDFSVCITQCQRDLREHTRMGPFWRIKTYCLLAGACHHDRKQAEVSITPLDQPSR
jgi:hypothetical protein